MAHYAQHKEEVYSCEECFKSFNSSSKVDVEVGHINKFYSSTKAKSKVGQ